jgi:hypothetical protein
MKLLVEQNDVIKNFQQILVESEIAGSVVKHTKISGVFMSAEEKNRNGRIYPREVLKEAIDDYQKYIEEKSSWGAIDHPAHLDLNLKDASHLITKLEMVGNDVYGEAIVLDETENGRIIKNALSVAGKLGVSSRGAGEIKEMYGTNYVCEGFKLVTVDFVARPSAHRAFTNIHESEEYIYQDGSFIKKPFNIDSYSSFLSKLSKTMKV